MADLLMPTSGAPAANSLIVQMFKELLELARAGKIVGAAVVYSTGPEAYQLNWQGSNMTSVASGCLAAAMKITEAQLGPPQQVSPIVRARGDVPRNN